MSTVLNECLMAFCTGNLLEQLENLAVVRSLCRGYLLVLHLAAKVFGLNSSVCPAATERYV